MSEGAQRKADRLDFVDVLRGVAVVLMILWHTVDAWLEDRVRYLDPANQAHGDTLAYGILRLLGGMAAPLFVTLAGTSLALKTAADVRKGTPRALALRGSVARGLEVVVLGYLLRWQFWIIDAAGIRRPYGWAAILLSCGGLLAVWWATKLLGKEPKRAAVWAVLGLASDVLGMLVLSRVDPPRVLSVLRVDVLQAIGASLVVLAPLAPLLAKRWWLGALLGVGICVATPWVTKLLPGPLPGPVAGYVGRWPLPAGAKPFTLFPLFPWLGFASVGYALGVLWSDAAKRGVLARTVAWHAALGLVLAVGFNETLAVGLHWIDHLQWAVPLVRMLSRIGIALVFGGLSLLALRVVPSAKPGPVRAMGRRSMMVYWLHLELAFGVIADPIKRKVGLGGWAFGFAAIVVLMYGLVLLREGPVESLLARRRARAA